MKNLILASLVLVAACGGSKSKSSDTMNNGTGGGMGMGSDADGRVDPTIPSWAPKSCIAYAKAVTQAIACDAVDKGERDSIQSTYDTDLAAWKAETNATPEKISEVEASCTEKTGTVRAAFDGKCVPPAQ